MRKIGFFRTNRLPVSNELAGYHAWPSPELLGWATEVLRRDRYVAVDDGLSRHFHSSSTPQQIWVPAAEADRWVEATRALVERVKEILRQEREALTRLNPATTPLRRRILWMVRHASGSASMRKEYQSVGAQLYCEMARAYQTYDEQAADLADHINADIERRKQKARREQEAQRRRELREREQRAAALGGPEDAVWACRVADSGDWRRIEVWVPALDERPPGSRRPPLLTNATAREVQAEIERERAEHPYTAVHWSLKTAQAMRERQGNQYGDEDATWEELTGQRIERYPIRPGDGRGSRRTGAHGPSSTYGSDYGAGGDYGGGYGGGGDYGGGGYGGGFGGSF